MLASDSVKSGNQKVQVLRAVTFNLIGKGPPKVTLLKALSSFLTFFTQCAFQCSARFSHIPSLCGTDVGTWMVLSWLLECPVFVAFHTAPFLTSPVAPEGGGREQPRGGASSNFPGLEDWKHFILLFLCLTILLIYLKCRATDTWHRVVHHQNGCNRQEWAESGSWSPIQVSQVNYQGAELGRSRPAVPQHWPQLDAFWRSRW